MAIRGIAGKLVATFAIAAFAGSLFLWVWNLGLWYRPLTTPVCAIHLRPVMLQSAAREDGIHFLAMKNRTNQSLSFQIGHGSLLGSAGYHHGIVINILGLVLAMLPTPYNGGDYMVQPHAAVVLPYWCVVIGSGLLLSISTPSGALLRRRFRWSRASAASASLIGVVFTVLSFIPTPVAGPMRPRSLYEWAAMVLDPHGAFPTALFAYGFPFSCYRSATVAGKAVNSFRGFALGWKPHRLMDNVCIAILAALAVALIVEWLRQKAVGRTAGKAIQ